MAIKGLIRIGAGVAIFLAARWWLDRIVEGSFTEYTIWVPAALALVAISLVLHFGLFGIAAAVLRHAGFDCRPLFRAPLHSRTLAEFWSRRWNLAFSEMVSIAVQRPLARTTTTGIATIGAFACSGLFHEMAISWPVQRGYGLPLFYFLLQGIFVVSEPKLATRPLAQKALTASVILLPLPLLFHPWFLAGIVLPLLRPGPDYFQFLPCIR